MSSSATARIQRAMQASLVNAVLGNERIAREFDLRVIDLQTLHLLVLRDDVRTPKQISEVSALPTSTVTRVLDRLEAAGYLRRVPDAADRRRLRIELDDDRIAPIVRRYDRYGDALARAHADFTAAELDTVARYLERTASTF